ncbi:hypothetical protein M0R45_025712 [Rubus argutus]|uniref:Uncharacterized protein n=1 Tax=Rubus argutus TaxID=59490 RepID=A0AAW1WVF1_RUBAR
MASANVLSLAKPSPQENGKGFAEFSGTLRNSSANCLQFGRKNSEDFMSVIAFHSSSAQHMVSKPVTSKEILPALLCKNHLLPLLPLIQKR